MCSTDRDCANERVTRTCCNWDATLGQATTGTCGEMCLHSNPNPDPDPGMDSDASSCPATSPRPGAECSLPSLHECEYTLYCCEATGECMNTTRANCDGQSRTWMVAIVDPRPCVDSVVACSRGSHYPLPLVYAKRRMRLTAEHCVRYRFAPPTATARMSEWHEHAATGMPRLGRPRRGHVARCALNPPALTLTAAGTLATARHWCLWTTNVS